LLGRDCKFHVINLCNDRDIVWRSWKPQNQKSQHSEQAFLYFFAIASIFLILSMSSVNIVTTLIVFAKLVDNYCTFLFLVILKFPALVFQAFQGLKMFENLFNCSMSSGFYFWMSNAFHFFNKKELYLLLIFTHEENLSPSIFDFLSPYLWIQGILNVINIYRSPSQECFLNYSQGSNHNLNYLQKYYTAYSFFE